MGKSTISAGPFSIAMLNYQRVVYKGIRLDLMDIMDRMFIGCLCPDALWPKLHAHFSRIDKVLVPNYLLHSQDRKNMNNCCTSHYQQLHQQ